MVLVWGELLGRLKFVGYLMSAGATSGIANIAMSASGAMETILAVTVE